MMINDHLSLALTNKNDNLILSFLMGNYCIGLKRKEGVFNLCDFLNINLLFLEVVCKVLIFIFIVLGLCQLYLHRIQLCTQVTMLLPQFC